MFVHQYWICFQIPWWLELEWLHCGFLTGVVRKPNYSCLAVWPIYLIVVIGSHRHIVWIHKEKSRQLFSWATKAHTSKSIPAKYLLQILLLLQYTNHTFLCLCIQITGKEMMWQISVQGLKYSQIIHTNLYVIFLTFQYNYFLFLHNNIYACLLSIQNFIIVW